MSLLDDPVKLIALRAGLPFVHGASELYNDDQMRDLVTEIHAELTELITEFSAEEMASAYVKLYGHSKEENDDSRFPAEER